MAELNSPPLSTDHAGRYSPETQSLPVFEKTDSDLHATKVKSPSRNKDKEEVITIDDGLEYPGLVARSFIVVALLLAMFLVQDLKQIVQTSIH